MNNLFPDPAQLQALSIEKLTAYLNQILALITRNFKFEYCCIGQKKTLRLTNTNLSYGYIDVSSTEGERQWYKAPFASWMEGSVIDNFITQLTTALDRGRPPSAPKSPSTPPSQKSRMSKDALLRELGVKGGAASFPSRRR